MTERPILFSGPMVRALLDGTKTQTRRALKQQPTSEPFAFQCFKDKRGTKPVFAATWAHDDEARACLCPYGVRGDRLYVREKWWVVEREGRGIGEQFLLYDDEWKGSMPDEAAPLRPVAGFRFGPHPSIHLPRDFSRLILEIVAIRVERVQDISEADAIAEGVTDSFPEEECNSDRPFAEGYGHLWKHINGAASWDANPWVWVVEFKRAA